MFDVIPNQTPRDKRVQRIAIAVGIAFGVLVTLFALYVNAHSNDYKKTPCYQAWQEFNFKPDWQGKSYQQDFVPNYCQMFGIKS